MYGAYKEKERVWKRESRMKAPSPRKAVAERRKCRERVRLHKLRKKLSTSQDANSTDLEFAYKSPQASGKAVHKDSPFFSKQPKETKSSYYKDCKVKWTFCIK